MLFVACSHAAPSAPIAPLSTPADDPKCSGEACIPLAQKAFDAKEYASAARLFERGCESVPAACGALAAMYREGVGVDQDLGKALALYTQACKAEDPRSCNDLALGYELGVMVDKDPAKANDLFQHACASGFAEACTNLGFDYARGFGVRADASAAAIFYQQGCDGRDWRGCTKLAAAYVQGQGVDADPQRAVLEATKACDGKYMEGCVVLGFVYLQGLNDAAKGASYFDLACTAGEASGCQNLAVLYRDGIGVPKDRDKAEQLVKKACQLGSNVCD